MVYILVYILRFTIYSLHSTVYILHSEIFSSVKRSGVIHSVQQTETSRKHFNECFLVAVIGVVVSQFDGHTHLAAGFKHTQVTHR